MTGFEFFLLGLLKAAVGGAVAGAVIALVCLHWDRIVNWFQSRLHLKLGNPHAMGFSLQERMENGRYRSVYGVFDTHTRQLMDAEAVSSESVDHRVRQLHGKNELVLFS